MKGYYGRHSGTYEHGAIFPEGGGQGTIVEVPGVEIWDVLGSGANGIVFGANDSLGRDVVIKVYPPRVDRAEAVSSYSQARAEAEKISQLKHPGLSTVYSFGRLGQESLYWRETGWPYVVMEYRPGRPLKEVLPLLKGNFAARLSILRQIFDVLAYAESSGCLHGDLHGGNVLIDLPDDGSIGVSVIDFGTSALND
jgi:serine/threonine protein kinase